MITPHTVIDDAFPADLVTAAAASWPAPDWPHWLRYWSALEKKRTCCQWEYLPAACAEPLRWLLLLNLADVLLGRDDAVPDMSLYGAGLHSMGAGDYLDIHLDADRHRHTGLERRANALLFVGEWQPEWGGQLELWDAELTESIQISPRSGRLVLFAASDTSYHGVLPLRCPPEAVRRSLAVYWWGMPSGPGWRPRAQFVARPGQSTSAELTALRVQRAS